MQALGFQSNLEITRTKIRVRTAMATQTREHGRYLRAARGQFAAIRIDGQWPGWHASGCRGGRALVFAVLAG